MAFMQPTIYKGEYWEVSANGGETHIVPCDSAMMPSLADLRDYIDGTPDLRENGDIDAERHTGWLSRLSAPGYLDCTDWNAHATEDAAKAHLAEMYDLCESCLEDLNEDYACTNSDCAECSNPELDGE